MNIERHLRWNHRLCWAIDLALFSALLGLCLHGLTHSLGHNAQQNTTSSMRLAAKAAQDAPPAPAQGVAKTGQHADQAEAWLAIQHWMLEHTPSSGQCRIALANIPQAYVWQCIGFHDEQAGQHGARSVDTFGAPSAAILVHGSAEKPKEHASEKPLHKAHTGKPDTAPKGWVELPEGRFHFDASTNRWTDKP